MIEGVIPNSKPPPALVRDANEKSVRAGGADGLSFGEVLSAKKKKSAAEESEETAAAVLAVVTPAQTPQLNPSAPERGLREAGDAQAAAVEGAGECVAALQTAGTGSEDGAITLENGSQVLAECAVQAAPAGGQPGMAAAVPEMPGLGGADGQAAAVLEVPALEGAAGQPKTIAGGQSGSAQDAKFETLLAAQDAETQMLSVPVEAPVSGQAAVDKPLEPAPAARIETEHHIEVQKSQTAADPSAEQVAQVAASNSTHPELQVSGSQGSARMAEAPKDMLNEIARNVQLMNGQQQTSLHMTLHPHELGSIDIRLISNQNGVGILVLAERAATGRLLESQANQLQQTMVQAGVQVSHMFIGQNSQQDTQANLFAQQHQEHGLARDAQQAGGRKMDQQPPEPKKQLRYSLIDYQA